MTTEEAENLIIAHAKPVDLPDGHSFLGNLRPYQGKLYESNFLEIIGAIGILAPHYQSSANVSREVIGALWDICWLGRCWAIHPKGMLQSNRLISKADTDILEDWIDRISEAVAYLLGGGNVDDVMNGYIPIADRKD